MAYKQTPGRGNSPKTGHGIPTPFKQMGIIKAIGNKIASGAQWLSEAAEGQHGSTSYSGGDESSRQKNLPAAKPVAKKPESPAKQMDFIKSVGNKIYEGAKYLSETAEGQHGSSSYSGGDEQARQSNTPSSQAGKAKALKANVVKATGYRDTSYDDSRYSDKVTSPAKQMKSKFSKAKKGKAC